jgi:hypothetical protein
MLNNMCNTFSFVETKKNQICLSVIKTNRGGCYLCTKKLCLPSVLAMFPLLLVYISLVQHTPACPLMLGVPQLPLQMVAGNYQSDPQLMPVG